MAIVQTRATFRPIRTIRRVKPAFFNGVPTLYIALLNRPEVQRGQVDFRSIKICISGAAPLMADTRKRFESLTGARIVEGYSLTEAMMATCINPVKGPNKPGSVGMPLPDVHVRIFDGDEGTRVLPSGQVGEIAISGLQLMTVTESPGGTAGVLRDHADETGTTVVAHRRPRRLDDDGYVFIVDGKRI